jgi:hypothetical protein
MCYPEEYITIIIAHVVCVHENWTNALRENKLMEFEKVKGRWRKLHKDKLH